MPRNYYQELKINRTATREEIVSAYRQLCLKWHPQLSKEDPQTTLSYFNKISEAYEVLSDPVKKAFYDKYGEEQLKNGFFNKGELKGGYRYQNNPYDVFNKFFLQENPYAQISDEKGDEVLGSMFGHAFGGQKNHNNFSQEDIIVEVECTLSELYNGCSKNIVFERIILNEDERSTSIQVINKLIYIQPGFGEKSSLVYKREGNQAFGQDPSNLIVKLVQIPHPQFKRVGNDLIYTAQISIIDALSCSPINIITLDGRELSIPIDVVIQPNKDVQKVVKGEGFQIYKENIQAQEQSVNKQKGDLKIIFDVCFPKNIPNNYKQELVKLLQ